MTIFKSFYLTCFIHTWHKQMPFAFLWKKIASLLQEHYYCYGHQNQNAFEWMMALKAICWFKQNKNPWPFVWEFSLKCFLCCSRRIIINTKLSTSQFFGSYQNKFYWRKQNIFWKKKINMFLLKWESWDQKEMFF